MATDTITVDPETLRLAAMRAEVPNLHRNILLDVLGINPMGEPISREFIARANGVPVTVINTVVASTLAAVRAVL